MADKQQSGDTLVNNFTLVVAITSTMWMFWTPLRGKQHLLGYAQDDFYYYLVIARNLASGLGSTFDGSTPTNGYHPLYLVLLYIACRFTRTLQGIFKFLAVIDSLSAIAIFLSVRVLFAKHFRSVMLTNMFALALLVICRLRICYQMEVTLTIPLGMLFLLLLDKDPEMISLSRCGWIGVSSALMILSRLDAVILVGVCGLTATAVPAYRRALNFGKIVAFLCGMIPLLATYFAINKLVFHRLMPISGAAKQLKAVYGFTWKTLVRAFPKNLWLEFGVAFLTVLLLATAWKRLSKEHKVIFAGAALFPFLHWFVNIWFSDWDLWPWYRYSLTFSEIVLLTLLGTIAARYSQGWVVKLQVGALASMLFITSVQHYRIGLFMMDTAVAAEGIRDFAKDHHGRYAMGDRAGMVGYLMTDPLVQTEGLMMDDAYLQHIRQQDPLREVLSLYQIDYYAVFSWKPVAGCVHVQEPAQAGPDSPSLRAVFCEQPVWRLKAPSGGQTLIYDVNHSY